MTADCSRALGGRYTFPPYLHHAAIIRGRDTTSRDITSGRDTTSDINPSTPTLASDGASDKETTDPALDPTKDPAPDLTTAPAPDLTKDPAPRHYYFQQQCVYDWRGEDGPQPATLEWSGYYIKMFPAPAPVNLCAPSSPALTCLSYKAER